jgi:enoyl-CoA hydratase/carnithine racemase
MPKVLYDKKDRIAYVTINRPEVRNAIDAEGHAMMWKIWQDFAGDDGLDLAILTGAGDEAFCAGADLADFIRPLLPGDAGLSRRKLQDGFCGLTRGLHRIYKPVLAAVNGWAVGGGLELALACDIRIASENATFGSFEVRRGFHHGDGGIARLVNTCGSGVALELLLTGEPISAERAYALHLVSRVVPHHRLLDETERIGRQILSNDQWAVRSAKETVLDVIGRPLDDQLRIDCTNGYSGAANPRVPGLIDAFMDRSRE